MNALISMGFGPFFIARLDPSLLPDPPVGRIAFAAHGRARVVTATGECQALVPREPVVVGDWVLLREDHDTAVVTERLERRTTLRRRDPGGGTQVIAANVDVALVCTAVGSDLSVRRLERWLALVDDAGADPLVVLTKADRDADVARALGALAVAGREVLPVSARDDLGRAALLDRLEPGRTAALLGSSGVGKSTLVNWLLDADLQPTAAVRGRDGRGRHTTTARHLVALPGDRWLIDNPGVREVGLPGDADVSGAFPDVERLAGRCRFRDCGHDREPGCAVVGAVEAGTLDPGRLAAWQKLQRELAWETRRADPAAAREERDRWKRVHKAQRAHFRKKYGE